MKKSISIIQFGLQPNKMMSRDIDACDFYSSIFQNYFCDSYFIASLQILCYTESKQSLGLGEESANIGCGSYGTPRPLNTKRKDILP